MECSLFSEEIVMISLRQQMHDAMRVRGLAERTRQTYIENVARLVTFYHQNPAD
jgi:hypothetical protein